MCSWTIFQPCLGVHTLRFMGVCLTKRVYTISEKKRLLLELCCSICIRSGGRAPIKKTLGPQRTPTENTSKKGAGAEPGKPVLTRKQEARRNQERKFHKQLGGQEHTRKTAWRVCRQCNQKHKVLKIPQTNTNK